MVTLLSAPVLAGCEQKPQQDQSAATAPRQVESVAVKTESLTVINELPGRVEPVRVAQVRARVAGIVLTRNFEEGADVKAGAVLFQIDPAPFKAALSKAQGDLARTEATLFEAGPRSNAMNRWWKSKRSAARPTTPPAPRCRTLSPPNVRLRLTWKQHS